MRILLASLNARYVHTNLAIRYLKEVLKQDRELKSQCAAMSGSIEVITREYTINEQLDKIAARIFEEKPDVIGFSCYIWNITETLALIRSLKPVLPETKFVLGGPEVSYDPEQLMQQYSSVDAIVKGEGELILPGLIKAYLRIEDPDTVSGVVWRKEGNIIVNKALTRFCDLNEIPVPYAEDEDFRGKLVYVETSRGCPYNCSFCISSTFQGVRFLNPEKFRIILRHLFRNKARIIKFVDRTFNANKKHAFEILDVFREEVQAFTCVQQTSNGDGFQFRAHCEMAGELLDEDWLRYLASYPRGLIQLEIGVQSTHKPTLKLINRTQHFSSWKDKVEKIQHHYDIPVHLDLIAGLPEEGPAQFKSSFNEVISVRPNHLQLGFLKVLKGSEIRRTSDKYGLTYSPDAPYTILKTAKLSHQEILELHRVEELVERYYNSGKFHFVLEYIFAYLNDPFEFFCGFSRFWHQNGWFNRAWKSKALIENLWQYLQTMTGLQESNNNITSIWREALRFDLYLQERPGEIPDYLVEGWSEEQKKAIDEKREVIRRDHCWENRIPEWVEMDKRQWTRATAVGCFTFDVPEYVSQADLLLDLLNQNDHNCSTQESEQQVWFLFYYRGEHAYFGY